MKRILFVLIICAFQLLFAGEPAQIEKLFGTDGTPVDTTYINEADTALTRTIFFKNPHKIDGNLYFSGYMAKKAGTADTVFVDVRTVDEKYPQTIYGDWHNAVATIVPGDSATFRVSVSLETWWDFTFGYQARFRGAAGTFDYLTYATGTSR